MLWDACAHVNLIRRCTLNHAIIDDATCSVDLRIVRRRIWLVTLKHVLIYLKRAVRYVCVIQSD